MIPSDVSRREEEAEAPPSNVISIFTGKPIDPAPPATADTMAKDASTCACGSIWFMASVMFHGSRVLAYSRSSVVCAVCGAVRK